LLKDNIVALLQFFVYPDEVLSLNGLQSLLLNVIFDEESKEGYISQKVPSPTTEAPIMRGFLYSYIR
jgi:hypothetical protein